MLPQTLLLSPWRSMPEIFSINVEQAPLASFFAGSCACCPTALTMCAPTQPPFLCAARLQMMAAPHEANCSDLESRLAYKLQLRHHSEAGVPPEDPLAAQLVGHPTRGGVTLLSWLSANERTGHRSGPHELQKPASAAVVAPAQRATQPASPVMGTAWTSSPTSPPVQCRRVISMPGTKEAAVQPPASPQLPALKQQRTSGSGYSSSSCDANTR